MIWTLLVTLALAEPIPTHDHALADRFEPGLKLPSDPWPGSFAAAPVALWSVRLPGAIAPTGMRTERTRPVVIGDDVYVGSSTGSGIYKMSRRDGSLKHHYMGRASVEAEPTFADGMIFFSDTAGFTWAYTMEGHLRWVHDGGAPILVRPTFVDGRLHLTNVDDLAITLDATTGELIWRYQRPADLSRQAELTLYAAPAAVPVPGTREVLFGFSDGAVVALDGERGDILWEREVGEGRYPDLVSAPVALGNDVFASGYLQPLVAIDRTTGNVRWRLDYGAANAVVVDETRDPAVLYHPGTDGVLHAVVANTGAELWAWNSGTSGALTSPVITEAGLLIGSSDGLLYLVDKYDGRELWRYHEPVKLQGITRAPEVVGRQVLFVTNAGFLHSMVAPATPAPEQPKPYPFYRAYGRR